jgi:hypothetical protein
MAKSIEIGTEHCVYCGDYFQCRDHVIPVSYSSVYRSYKPGDTVHCCNRCNSFLSDKAHFTIHDRANYLIDIYRDRHWKDITFPIWEKQELEELGHNLRANVEKRLRLKTLYLNKIRNLELCSQGHPIVPIDPLIIRGKAIIPVLSHLDTLSPQESIKTYDENIRKKLKASLSQNIKKGNLHTLILKRSR